MTLFDTKIYLAIYSAINPPSIPSSDFCDSSILNVHKSIIARRVVTFYGENDFYLSYSVTQKGLFFQYYDDKTKGFVGDKMLGWNDIELEFMRHKFGTKMSSKNKNLLPFEITIGIYVECVCCLLNDSWKLWDD